MSKLPRNLPGLRMNSNKRDLLKSILTFAREPMTAERLSIATDCPTLMVQEVLRAAVKSKKMIVCGLITEDGARRVTFKRANK